MTLPLTNDIDSDNYVEGCLKVMHEFLSEYFTQALSFPADIRIEQDPNVNELTLPIIRFSLDPGLDDNRGAIGLDGSNDVIRGKFKALSWEVAIATDDNTGGILNCDRYAARFESIIDRYSFYLAEKHIKNHSLSGPVRIETDSYYQRTFILTNRLLLCRG